MCLASKIFPGICLADSTSGNLISSSILDIVCACQLDDSTNVADHHGELLVENGTMVNLQ
jgi:hypothetical protein